MPAELPPDVERLRAALLVPTGEWSSVEVLAEVGSTNAELMSRARDGAAHGSILITGNQTAGRGRLTRSWVTPPGVAIACSVLLCPPPELPVANWPWLSPLLGLAVSRGVERATGLQVQLKWPNDVLVDDRKLSGLLAERGDGPGGPVVVLGFGINVTADADELPVPTATSLLLEGAPTDSTELLLAVLSELAELWRLWLQDLDAVAQAYRAACDTIGREVRVVLGPDQEVLGRAVGVDADGGLQVEGPAGIRAYAAGDVVHLRRR